MTTKARAVTTATPTRSVISGRKLRAVVYNGVHYLETEEKVPSTVARVDYVGISGRDAAAREMAERFNGTDARTQALASALRRLLEAHKALMPCLKNNAVPDYQIQNEAPIEAITALSLLAGP